MEAVFEDLDPEDKQEFYDVQVAIKKRRVQLATHEYQRKRMLGHHRDRRRKKKRRRRSSSLDDAPQPTHRNDDANEQGESSSEGGVYEPLETTNAPQPTTPHGPTPPQSPHQLHPHASAEQLNPQAAAGSQYSQASVAEPTQPHTADSAAARASTHRGPNVLGHTNQWVDVDCDRCGGVAGQIKYHPNPGGRDGPSWYMRVRDPLTNAWAERAPLRRVLRTTRLDESGDAARDWVKAKRTCCC